MWSRNGTKPCAPSLDLSWIEDSVTPYVRATEAKIKPREMPVASDAPEQQRTLH
jgi:hypothetical protein